MTRPGDHQSIPAPKIGVLLINLGTPDAPEERAVRRYLAEFLSDRRVIEIHPVAWKPILHGIILRTRPKKSAEAYNQIWTNEGSPLRAIAHRQADALRARMPDVAVRTAMRYGHPGIAAAWWAWPDSRVWRNWLVTERSPRKSAATIGGKALRNGEKGDQCAAAAGSNGVPARRRSPPSAAARPSRPRARGSGSRPRDGRLRSNR